MLPLLRALRRSSVLFILCILLIVSILLHRSRLLISLLFEDGGSDRLYLHDLLSLNETSKEKDLIPKIIHQTWKNTSLPERWQAGQKKLLDAHEDWEYLFWTDTTALLFVRTHYPHFLALYTSYPHAIQRADILRYFLLHHYGGIYLDLDVSPLHSLSHFLSYPSFACLTSPTGISNDVLGSIPSHPFYSHVISHLREYDRNWGVDYFTVMYSTGSLFLSVMWVEYLDTWRKTERMEEGRVRVLVDGTKEEKMKGFKLFDHARGGSWHERDKVMVYWMWKYWGFVTAGGFILGFVAAWGIWGLVKMLAKRAWLEDNHKYDLSV